MLIHRAVGICKCLEVERRFACQIVFDFAEFLLESSGQYEKSHNFNDTDTFFLDVVQSFFGVEYAVRMSLVRSVVAEYEIYYVFVFFLAHDRRYRVVLIGSLADDVYAFVSPVVPCCKYVARCLVNLLFVFAYESDYAVVPVCDIDLDFLVFRALVTCTVAYAHHRKNFETALIVIVSKYRAAYDRQSGIAAHEVMGEQIDKIEQPAERRGAYVHRAVFVRESDRVFFVILIRRILQMPIFVIELYRYGAQRLSCRMVHIACKADVGRAEHACGVSALGLKFCQCDLFGILFGFRKVYRNAYLAELSVVFPLDVFLYVRHTDIVVGFA